MNFKQKRRQRKDEVDLVAQIGLEHESAARMELENKYLLSAGEVSDGWTG
jgi:hypothetical protein